MSFRSILIVFWGTCCVAAPVGADRFQAPTGPGGTWNVYQVDDVHLSWVEARQLAAQQTWQNVPGRLMTISTAQENAIAEYALYRSQLPIAWIGLTDREGAAPRVDHGSSVAPQESAPLADPFTQGWAWISGEPFAYQQWEPRGPRDFRGAEDAAAVRANGLWTDNPSGYEADVPVIPTLQSNSSQDERVASARAGLLVEYETAADRPWTDLPIWTSPAKMPADLPGVVGHKGTLGVTDLRMDHVEDHILAASTLLTDVWQGRITPNSVSSTHVAWADVTDPEGRRRGGPIVDTEPFRFPSDTTNQREHDLVSVAQGTVHVPQTGRYTIQVRSGGTFALQIGDAPFLRSGGDAQIDSVDPRTMFFSGFAGDSRSRATIDLTSGDHPLRFFSATGDSRAYWEITSARGEFLEDYGAQWLPIGADDSLPARSVNAPIRLVQPATVVNALTSTTDRAQNLFDAQTIVQSAFSDGTAWINDQVSTVVLRDHDGIRDLRPGARLDSSLPTLWPLNDPARGGNRSVQDHFSSSITGQLMADDGDPVKGETLEITVGVFASDTAQLRIHGARFLEGNLFTDLIPVADDVMIRHALADTTNTNMLAVVELQEGVAYDFEATHVNLANSFSDAGFEIWAASGRWLDGFDALNFLPLSRDVLQLDIPANSGLTLVAGLAGDFDRNGVLDAEDLRRLHAEILSGGSNPRFDLNADAHVSQTDQRTWVVQLRGTWIGDADLDGQFDSTDLLAALAAGKYDLETSAQWEEGDWNADGRFDVDDLLAAFADGGYEQGPRTDVTVPEPTWSAWFIWIVLAAAQRVTMRNHHEDPVD